MEIAFVSLILIKIFLKQLCGDILLSLKTRNIECIQKIYGDKAVLCLWCVANQGRP